MTSTWAFVPSAPLLVLPGDDPLTAAREAAASLVSELVAATPTSIAVLADADGHIDLDESHGGTLSRYGIDVRAGGERAALGLGHTIGAWLLDRAGWAGPRRYVSGLDAVDGTVLVVADGAACIATTSPRGRDPRGPGFQDDLLAALRSGDAAHLADLDVELAAELWCSGASVLRALGRAARQRQWHAELRYVGAPLGVGYWVARWRSA